METLKFAVVKDNICINTIIAETLEIAESMSKETCYLIPDMPIFDLLNNPSDELFMQINAASVGIGWHYDPNKNIFISPQPYPSWTLNKTNHWEPPIEYPQDGKTYNWNESKISWDLVEIDPKLMGA
jgi:hypothetical protein